MWHKLKLIQEHVANSVNRVWQMFITLDRKVLYLDVYIRWWLANRAEKRLADKLLDAQEDARFYTDWLDDLRQASKGKTSN